MARPLSSNISRPQINDCRTGQRIDPLVLDMAVMAFDPVEFDLMLFQEVVNPQPEMRVLDRFAGGIFPAALFVAL